MLPPQLRELSKKDSENKVRRIAIISKTISEVENIKQIHLSDGERDALIEALDELPEPIENIVQRGKALIANKDYNRIPYDAWLNVQPLYTKQEAYKLANEIIEQQARRLRSIGFSEEELAKAGLVSVQTTANIQYENLVERERAKLKVRIRKAVVFFKTAPEETKLEIKAIAESKGYKDEFWRQSIPVVMVFLLEEVEQIMRRI